MALGSMLSPSTWLDLPVAATSPNSKDELCWYSRLVWSRMMSLCLTAEAVDKRMPLMELIVQAAADRSIN